MTRWRTSTIAVAIGTSIMPCSFAFQRTFVPEVARQMITELYPELNGSRTRIAFLTPSYRLSQSWTWHEITANISEDDPSRTGTRLLDVAISFDSSEYVSALRASGPFVKTEQRRRLVEEVDRHPEWSDERVLRALRESGAHFTPDRIASPQRIFEGRVRALDPFLGTAKPRSIEFEIRDEPRERGDQAARLYWHVEIDVLAAPGRPSSYDVFFEPFEGRLIEIRAPVQ